MSNIKKIGTTESGATKHGKSNGYKSAYLWAKRERLQNESMVRMSEHTTLTIEEKIAKAKTRRGKSSKEINRLTDELIDQRMEQKAKALDKGVTDAVVKEAKKQYNKPKRS